MNDRVRVYELARKMNLDNQVVINALRELGYDVKSHSSTIDAQAVGLLIAHIGKKKEPAKPEAKSILSPTTKAPGPTSKSSASKAAAAAPPAPVQKPRVLARYRREPVVETPTEQTAEPAPVAAIAPTPEPAAVIAPPVSAPIPAVVEIEEPIVAHITEPQVELSPLAEQSEDLSLDIDMDEDLDESAAMPSGPSRAVLEQRRQMAEIEVAQERSKKRVEEQQAQTQLLAEQKIRDENQRKQEAARKVEDMGRRYGNQPPREPSRDQGQRPQGGGGQNNDPSRQMRDAFSGGPPKPGGAPSSPSGAPSGTPGQPIRVGTPSFRATPPRPPKSHNRQPQERHAQQQQQKQKAEDKRAAAIIEIPKMITISGPVTVKELAEKMVQPETEIIKRLFMKGIMRTVNQMIEPDPARELAIEMGYELQSAADMAIDAAIAAEEAGPKPEILTDEDRAALVTRAPIVTIMGHVDHGKTSLLDAIRQTKFLLTDAEHGGITQHIGAYHVEVTGEDGTLRQIVFLDTPGHEAFTAMRARGTKVTDIAILVVAADDGVMPQTIEAIDHAKAAGVPVVVAINKIDKADADPDRVLTDLMKHGIVPDKFGGDTVTCNVSAKKKTGLDELLEMILLVADMQDLKANPEKPASGSIIEAELSRGKGAVATALVANGTLREGDCIVAGSCWGRVRALFDDRGQRVKAAGPSMPVEVLGLKEVPQAGDRFEVVVDESFARDLAEKRRDQEVEIRRHHVTLESLHDMMQAGEVKELDIIVKADVQGTAEAIAEQIVKLSGKEVVVRILRTASGDISETDVNLAASSNAIIIGFNIQPDNNAKSAADTAGVDIRTYNTIYQIIDDLNLAIQGLLQPIRKEFEVGTAEIRALFKVGKNQMIAGCMVTSGKIPRGSGVRVEREGQVVYEGKIDTLKRFKDDAKEVAQGFECGMSFEKFTELKEGDIVRAFAIQEIKRELTR